jgi:hypothetical protein
VIGSTARLVRCRRNRSERWRGAFVAPGLLSSEESKRSIPFSSFNKHCAIVLASSGHNARETKLLPADIDCLQDFLQQIGKSPAGLVQFFPDDICRPRTVTHLVRLGFFVRFPCRDDTIVLLLRMHIRKIQSFVRLTRDR